MHYMRTHGGAVASPSDVGAEPLISGEHGVHFPGRSGIFIEIDQFGLVSRVAADLVGRNLGSAVEGGLENEDLRCVAVAEPQQRTFAHAGVVVEIGAD